MIHIGEWHLEIRATPTAAGKIVGQGMSAVISYAYHSNSFASLRIRHLQSHTLSNVSFPCRNPSFSGLYGIDYAVLLVFGLTSNTVSHRYSV